MDPLTRQIAERIAVARKEKGFSQEALADVLGFNDRQTVSAMETGVRDVSSEELAEIARILDRSIDDFTDPYVVAEANAFSYRAERRVGIDATAFEGQARRLISAQRRFRELLGETPSPVQPQLPSLYKTNPADFAAYQGELSAKAWNLGPVPASRLLEAAEKHLGITVLFVDAPLGISGAACRLSDGGFVLINRNEASVRRHFDLGHEIFHLLTWDRMPPEKRDVVGEKSRVEMLADAYTAGLLMPSEVVRERWNRRGEDSLAVWIFTHSRELLVSPEALYWRLVNLEHVDPKETRLSTAMKAVAALKAGAGPIPDVKPALLSAAYVRRLHAVLDDGRLTVLKAAELLNTDYVGLSELFEGYGLRPPFDF